MHRMQAMKQMMGAMGTPGAADIAPGEGCATQSYISDLISPMSRNTGILTVSLV